jgi:hypothetical protein
VVKRGCAGQRNILFIDNPGIIFEIGFVPPIIPPSEISVGLNCWNQIPNKKFPIRNSVKFHCVINRKELS